MPETEIIIRSLCCGILLTVGIAMLRTGRSGDVGWTGALFCLATAGFVIQTGGPFAERLGLLRHPAWLLSAGGTAYFWLFAVSLFEDRPFTPARLLVPLLMTAIPVIGRVLGPSAQIGTETVHNLFEVVLVLHIVVLIRRSAAGDLIDVRRSMRTPFLLAVALLCILLSGLDVAWTLGFRPPWMKLSQSVALLVASAAGAWALLPLHPALFNKDWAPDQVAGNDAADAQGLARLRALMADQAYWRTPSLTLADTARRLALPEYRLRRLINRELAFRNFPDLVNAQRIGQAKLRLADPAHANAQISTIAFDLGFASLGPFNRAFRAATGMSPRQWRQHQAAQPIAPGFQQAALIS